MAKRSQRRTALDNDDDMVWRNALQYALEQMLRGQTPYGTSWPIPLVIAVSDSGAAFEVELRFQHDKRYCCCEPGCFLAAYDAKWWRKFRALLKDVDDRDPPPFSIAIHGVVEAGAKMLEHKMLGFEETSKASSYTHGPTLERDAGKRQ